jgi:hypothetical protein
MRRVGGRLVADRKGGALFQILEWARDNGELLVIERIRLKVLSASIREGIQLGKVTPRSGCSNEYLNTVRRAVEEVVGKPCPY